MEAQGTTQTSTQGMANPPAHPAHSFPWKHVIGFILSLVLTFIAFWLVVKMSLPASVVLTSIMILAIFQVLVQLLLFMHLTEKRGPAFHTILLIFGFMIAIAVVGGSIWIMNFTMHATRVS